MCAFFESEIFKLFVPSFLTILSWYAISNFTSKRDSKNRQTEIKIKYLVEAYRDISIFITRNNNDCLTVEVHINFERAIRDIQIYGSSQEIKLVTEYISNLRTKGFDVDPLLNTLKNNLRSILELEQNEISTHWAVFPELFHNKNTHSKDN